MKREIIIKKIMIIILRNKRVIDKINAKSSNDKCPKVKNSKETDVGHPIFDHISFPVIVFSFKSFTCGTSV